MTWNFVRLLGTALLLATASTADAQSYATDRGAMILGGSVSLASSGNTGGGERSNSFTFAPSAMYFVTPGLAIGGRVSVQHGSLGDVSSTSFGVGPAVTYYFGGPDSSTYPYLGANLAYSRLTGDRRIDSSVLGMGGQAGLAVMLSEAVALLLEANYWITAPSLDEFDDNGSNQFRLQAGFGAFLF